MAKETKITEERKDKYVPTKEEKAKLDKIKENVKVESTKTKQEKEQDDKLKELKMELLKQPQKRKSIKKEIARILTAKNSQKAGERKINK
jgi:ribosomal protein L29